MKRRSEAPLLVNYPNAQTDALDMMTRNRPMHGTMFSYDRIRKVKGKNKAVKGFYTVGWHKFFCWYRMLPPAQRIMYENLMPGTKELAVDNDMNKKTKKKSDACFMDWPEEELRCMALCHLFGDVDVMMYHNKNLDIDSVFSKFMQEIVAFYREYFGEEEPVVRVADSTGETPDGLKFSRHFVIKSASGRMFASVAHVGAFTRSFAYMLCKKYGPPEKNVFFVSNGPGKGYGLLLDLGVATKYRGFRLVFSSKINKKRWLRPIGDWMPGVRDITDMTYDQFLDSLVQYSPHDEVEVLYAFEPDGGPARWTSDSILKLVEWVDGTAIVRKRVNKQGKIVKSGGEMVVKYRETPDGDDWSVDWQHAQVLKDLQLEKKDSIVPNEVMQAAQNVADAWCKGDWTNELFLVSDTTFSFSSNRHGEAVCPHIKQAHKSNRIKYLLSLRDRDGLFVVASYVSCFDTDCINHYTAKKVWTPQTMGPELYDLLEAYDKSIWEKARVEGSGLASLFLD